MLSKIVLLVSCLYLVQASVAVGSEHGSDGVTNFADTVLSRSRRSCGAGECNAHCKKLGHARGVCIGTYCQCRSRLRRSLEAQPADNLPEVTIEENPQSNLDASSLTDVIKSRSTRATCSYDGCNTFCRKLGHARGVCIGSYCQCRFRRRRSLDAQPADFTAATKAEEKLESSSGVTNLAEAVLSRSRRSCGAGECNAHCKKLGHARGVCIGTYCQCRSR